MKKRMRELLLAIVLCFSLVIPNNEVQAAQTITGNQTGSQDGYNYELWKDSGTTSMTLNSGGTFSCQWSNIGNALFRKGIKFDSTKTYQQLGNISVDYGCTYSPSGNSYLCVYGWTKSPLIEYYIVDSWGTWRPPGATSKGTITVDGGTYDIYETTRVNQPSIEGNATFKQFWSVRTSKRTSGVISVTEHFKAWESKGMQLGKLYEVALTVEGYQSSGSADVYKNNITIGGSGTGSNTGNTGNTGGNVSTGNAKVECENMTLSGSYAGKISSPFSGVALYANNDTCKFTQNFTSSTNSFTLRGCSNNSSTARVDLKIGGQTKGSFYFSGSTPTVSTLSNISHGTGNQEVELVVTTDSGQWDAYIDYLEVSGEGSSGGNTGVTTTPTQTPTQTPTTPTTAPTNPSTSGKTECENMTLSGSYAGKISSPFSGVALYANNDTCKFTQNFTSSTNNFSLRGCSNNSSTARVDLKIGGQTKGSFYFSGSTPTVSTLYNVSHSTGNQEVQLVVTTDTGQWDAYIDYLEISGESTSNSGNTGNTNTGNTGNINASTKMVALTFDDGPSSTTTTQILDILQRYNVVGTFFLIGKNVNSNTKSIMQRQLSLGCELANHSYNHNNMSSMSASQIQSEISQTTQAIKNMVGADVKFFRPPYLGTSNTMYTSIDLNFIQGITCNDWESSVSASQRANTVLNSVSDGSIILLHDFEGNSNTVSALPAIIEGLKAKGYTFVTVSQLFQYKGVNPSVEYKIWSNVYN